MLYPSMVSPSIFLTISPYEWSFPFPAWLEDMRGKTGHGPTKIAGPETLHIANTLEQIVRGYLFVDPIRQSGLNTSLKTADSQQKIT